MIYLQSLLSLSQFFSLKLRLPPLLLEKQFNHSEDLKHLDAPRWLAAVLFINSSPSLSKFT